MTLYLGNFWNKFDSYPDKLIFFDRVDNKEDSLIDKMDMEEFIEENSDCEVIDFEVSFKENYIYVEIE